MSDANFADRWVANMVTQGATSRGAWEEGGQWHAKYQGNDLGPFGGKAEALKAYRRAVAEKFKEATLPSDEEIDAAVQRESQS